MPKSAKGLPVPFPSGMGAQSGFQLVTAMTLHGVTRDITWNVVATFTNASVSGRATTTFDFATFNITKPSLARLLSVDDKIHLEIEVSDDAPGAIVEQDLRRGRAWFSSRAVAGIRKTRALGLTP